MARSDGRALDALRPVEMIAGFHRPSGGLGPLPRGGHRGALHRFGRRQGAPVSRRQGPGLGDGRVPDAPAREPAAARARRARQGAERAHAGDPAPRRPRAPRRRRHGASSGRAPSRSTATCSRPTAARARPRSPAASWPWRWRSPRSASRALREPVAATSVGLLEGAGSRSTSATSKTRAARVDLNVVATASGKIVEVQGTAEGEPVERREIDAMVDLALAGIAELAQHAARRCSRARGVDLAALRERRLSHGSVPSTRTRWSSRRPTAASSRSCGRCSRVAGRRSRSIAEVAARAACRSSRTARRSRRTR